MGKISKGQKCTVKGCENDALRSINVGKAQAAGLEVEGRTAYLCETHYKIFKKVNKKTSQIEKWRHGI